MAKGLPDVVQKFGAENSDYLRALNENREALRGQVESLEEHRRAVERNQRAVEEFADDLADAQRRLIAVKQAQDELKNSILSGGDDLGGVLYAALSAAKQLKATQEELVSQKGYGRLIADWKEIHRGFQSVGDILTYDVLNGFKRVQDQQDASLMTVKQLKAAQAELATQIRQTGLNSVQSSVAQGNAVDAHRVKLEELKSTIIDVSGRMAQLASPKFLTPAREDPSIPAATWLPDRGGGAGGGFAALMAGGAARGGGGKGILSAAGYADAIAAWSTRVAPLVHYVTMAAAEALATVIPATIAGGAAAAVSVEGAHQLFTRGSAIYSAFEALPSTPIPSAFQGVISQNYANAGPKYAGGVYGLAGGLSQLMQMGAGGFDKLGGQTTAMLDRSMAGAIVNAKQKGTLGTLTGLLGAGTGYLQQFGAVGANLGNLLLGMAPNLPGVGADWLSALEGVTGAAAGGTGFLNRHGAGPAILGSGLAAEAGWRLGTPLIGLAGRGLTGLGGLAGKMGLGSFTRGLTAKDIAGMSGEDLAGLMEKAGVTTSRGLIGMFGEGEGLAGALGGTGEALGMLGGPEMAVLAAGAYAVSKIKPPASEQRVAALQAGIGQAGFSSAFKPLAQALTTTTKLAGAKPASYLANIMSGWGAGETAPEEGRFGPIGPTNTQVYARAAGDFAQQLGSLTAAAPQLVTALSKMGMNGVSFAGALQLAQNALLDIPHSFGPNGKLTGKALQQLSDYASAIIPMTQSPGAFGAAVAAGQIMSSAPMQKLQQVNQVMDSMTSLMTGGPAGASSFFGLLGGAPVTATTAPRRAGIQLKAPTAYKGFANALTSFTSPAGAADWQTMVGQNGLVPTLQQNLDQFRNEMLLNAISQPQAAGMGAFQIEQLLPMAKKSPALLSTLMSMGVQAGIPGATYYTGSTTSAANQAQMYKTASDEIGKHAISAKRFNIDTNKAAEHMANLGKDAGTLAQSLTASAQSQEVGKAAQQLVSLRGSFSKAGVKSLVADMQAAGAQGGKEITAAINSSMSTLHFSPGAIKAIDAQLSLILTPKVMPPHLPKINPVEYLLEPKVIPPHFPKIPDQYYKIVGQVVIAGGGMTGTHFTNLPAAHQAGYLVPGSGSGDIVPALLEPGEAVIPKRLVAMLAPLLGAHGIPGFPASSSAQMLNAIRLLTASVNMPSSPLVRRMQAGGSVSGLNLAQVNAEISTVWQQLDALYAQENVATGSNLAHLKTQVNALWQGTLDPLYARKDALTGTATPQSVAQKTVQQLLGALQQQIAKDGVWKSFAESILDSLTNNLTKLPKTSAGMTALANRVTQETSYAQRTAAGIKTGLGLGQMQVASPTMTAQGQPYQYYIDQQAAANGSPVSVQQQMGDYLQAVKSFGGDISKLAKGHLNKTLLGQVINAGPIQGDAVAQSILGGPGGVSAVNKLWNQIGNAANSFGKTAAYAQYGSPAASLAKTGSAAASAAAGLNSLTTALNSAGAAGSLSGFASEISSVTSSLKKLSGVLDTLDGSTKKQKEAAQRMAGGSAHGGLQPSGGPPYVPGPHGSVINVSVNVSGGGGGIRSDGTLSPGALNQVTHQIQTRLLQSTKNNRRTGLQLRGYAS